MPIKINKFSYDLDLTEQLDGVPRSKHKKVKEDIGKILLRSIDSDTRNQTSPVDGDRYKALTKNYKKLKQKMGHGGSPNLHLKNKMIKALKSKNTADGIKLEITRKKIIPQAYNHNIGDTVPQRQVLPDNDLNEDFRPAIMKKVERIISKERSVEMTKAFKLRQQRRMRLEEELIGAIGKDNAQTILKEGLDTVNLDAAALKRAQDILDEMDAG